MTQSLGSLVHYKDHLHADVTRVEAFFQFTRFVVSASVTSLEKGEITVPTSVVEIC